MVSLRHLAFATAALLLLASLLVQRSAGGGPPASGQPRADGRELFVSPDGSAEASGTIEAPLSLARALSDESPARPGDTVWLRGGVYSGTFVSAVSGLPDAPIAFRQYPGERAIIDSAPSARTALTVQGSWTTFSGFEVMSSEPGRRARRSGPWPDDLRRGGGFDVRGTDNALVNLVVHDTSGGFGVWAESENTIVYGNIVFYNGWQGPDRAHGHGIYTQNKNGSRLVADNVVFNQFSHGIHAFGSDEAFLDNITLRGNVVFQNGSISQDGNQRDILLGGGRRAFRPVLDQNATLGAQSSLGWGGGCTDGVVTNNVFVGVTPLVLAACRPRMTGNVFVGETGDLSGIFTGATGDLSRDYPDNVFHSQSPSVGVHVMLRINRFDPSRALLAIYNWERRDAVEVDVSPFVVNGDFVEVIDVQDYFGAPVLSTTYRAGAPLRVPMTRTSVTPPVGEVPRPPQHTGPGFGTFILRKAAPGRGAAAPEPSTPK